ncbi:hypothetical protein NKH18_45320 [Streptomyces sp. M10(2022)]
MPDRQQRTDQDDPYGEPGEFDQADELDRTAGLDESGQPNRSATPSAIDLPPLV